MRGKASYTFLNPGGEHLGTDIAPLPLVYQRNAKHFVTAEHVALADVSRVLRAGVAALRAAASDQLAAKGVAVARRTFAERSRTFECRRCMSHTQL